MEAGDRFGDYLILKRLASGGMAEVYLARRTGLSGFTKPVAMKVILPNLAENKNFIEMFLNEARLAVALNHANIAQILDLGEWEGQYFISMEFAHGADLQQISTRARKAGRLLPLPYAAKVVSQIAEGLHYAHTKADDKGKPLEIVHRDVSPHNIILTFDGIAKLIDFGVAKAKLTFKEENEEGILKGKFSYMSPEQVRGMPVDPRSDVFALGIVLWEVCTGANLFRESSELLTLEAILKKPIPAPKELRGDMPPELEAIIMKALAKRTADRFQSASEMHLALELYLGKSGWAVSTQHLSEFLKKLFPNEFTEIRDLLEEHRRLAEAEGEKLGDDFVPWEPYEGAEKPARRPVAPHADEQQLPLTEMPTKPLPRRSGPPAPRFSRGATTGVTSATRPRNVSWLMVLLVILLLGMCAAGVFMIVQMSDSSVPQAAPEPAPPKTKVVTSGTLQVSSVPEKARVFVNGRPRGQTPVEIGGLPFNEELTVRIEKDGYEVYLIPVSLTSAKPAWEINAKLKKL